MQRSALRRLCLLVTSWRVADCRSSKCSRIKLEIKCLLFVEIRGYACMTSGLGYLELYSLLFRWCIGSWLNKWCSREIRTVRVGASTVISCSCGDLMGIHNPVTDQCAVPVTYGSSPCWVFVRTNV